MKHIVITSDKYLQLMPEFAERFNQYVGGDNVVDVLCYEKPIGLPANFNICSMGVQPEGKDWTTAMMPYFAKQEYPFMLLLEDYFITAPIDHDTLNYIAQYHTEWDKIDLSKDRAYFDHREMDNGVVISSQYARYRSSLQAAIWRPSYFRKFLKPGRNAWQFELEGEREAMGDGAIILGTTKGILQYNNIMLKGKDVR